MLGRTHVGLPGRHATVRRRIRSRRTGRWVAVTGKLSCIVLSRKSAWRRSREISLRSQRHESTYRKSLDLQSPLKLTLHSQIGLL